MAYTTGTANDWAALRSAMDTFLTGSLGFTSIYQNGVSAQDAGQFDSPTWELDGMYWNFNYYAANDEVQCWMSTGNDGNTVTFGDHTGSARQSGNENNDCSRVSYITFPLDYHFFGDESGGGTHDYFHMVLNPLAGLYLHMWMGYIDPTWGAVRPFGAFGAGGLMTNTIAYGGMSRNPGANVGFNVLYYPYSATPGAQETSIQNKVGTRLADGWCAAAGFNEQRNGDTCFTLPFMRGGQSSLTGRSILCPNPANVTDAANEGAAARTVFVGTYPGVHQISMEGIADEEEITVGADTYMIFPDKRRGSESQAAPFGNIGSVSLGTFNTGMLGWAYKKFV